METQEQNNNNLVNVICDESGNPRVCEITPHGRECQFLTFLEHASNFAWMKEEIGQKPSVEDVEEKDLHLLSKLCALGYLMIKRKEKEKSRAVILVGDQGSGIGTFLEMLTYARNVEEVDGDRIDLEKHLKDWSQYQNFFHLVDIVVVNNVSQSFDLSCMFRHITGKWPLKIMKPFGLGLAFQNSPKIIVTTKHLLNGAGVSYTDRQWILYFSDFNSHNYIIDYYGNFFFCEWEEDQWNLAFNLLAECMKLYLQFGFVQALDTQIKISQIRQYLGDSFISWADGYFSDPAKRNKSLIRRDVQNHFYKFYPLHRKYTSTAVFKKKLKKYCEWKGFFYNSNKGDVFDSKTAGFDTITIMERKP